ncbi:MAG: DUF2225 domain-containing protein [Synergistaceae bacterium]|nr:DUF2225 domain-containing protein [Synergistaceae bacterium]MBP9627097.1 DUF2225 domain-containing protein [Synergistaceae bacterium]MBP9958148.1 DUF2225 domain-containing protein [Synergistaceae bacterium]
MKWLHLSDIHYNPDCAGYNTTELLGKLPDYLREKNIKADNLFVTGDFRKALPPSDDEETAQKAVDFILEIARCIGIDDVEYIHIVPGNHDLARDATKDAVNAIMEKYTHGCDDFLPEDRKYLTDRFGFFQRVNRLLYKEKSIWPEDLSPLHFYRCCEDYNLLYLNTAVMCGGEKDRGHLIIGAGSLYPLLEKIKKENPSAPIVVLAHHAPEYFNDHERRNTEALFRENNVRLYLCGDAHSIWFRKTNNHLEITMGCLSGNEKGVQVAFCEGEITPGGIALRAHLWDKDRGWNEYRHFNDEFDKSLYGRFLAKEKPATPITRAIPLPPSAFFCGRETKIKEIRTELAGGSPLVLLSGMGGMGKTEICRHLFYLAKDTGLLGVENVGWLNYNGDISSTFYNQFEAVDAAIFNDPDEYLAQAKRYIRDQGKKLLLFIDNANDLSGKDMALVSGLGCTIVLTSRMPEMDRLKTITIDRLEVDDCLALYKSHSKDNDADITTLSEIIRLADRHTLTIELLAKAQNASGMSAGDLLQLLKEKSFDLSGITEKIPYSHQGERSTDEENPYENKFMEHLSVVFDIVDIEGEPLRVLRLFSLLPPDPLNGTDAAEWFELNNLDDLNTLEKKGWLSSVNQDGKKFSMHPVLASVIRYRGKPTCQECEHLISSLAKAISFGATEVFTIKLPFLPFAKSVANFFMDEEVSFAYSTLANKLSTIYRVLGSYAIALTYAQKAMAIRECVLGKEHTHTATTYSHIALVCSAQYDYAKALKYAEKAMHIYERVYGKEHPYAATAYNNIAVVYSEQSNYAKALEYNEKAIVIRERVYGKDHPDTATSYSNIAMVYRGQGNYVKALEYNEGAIAIRKKVPGKEHPDTATSYNNIALVYSDQGDYAKALKCYRKALVICKKIFGKKHPHTAATYSNIAWVYSDQGDYAKAIKHYKEALAIDIKLRGKEHFLTATTYNNLAKVCHNQGDYAKAIEYYAEALAICEKILGKEHPHTVVTYNNLAGGYEQLGDHTTALEYIKKALGEHPSEDRQG